MAKSGSAAPGQYPIRVVSKLTGIGIDTLRAWERRYGAVTPARDDRGRLYTDADVARLRLIHQAVSSGHSVGRVARLSDRDLRRLTARQPLPAAPRPVRSPPPLESTALAAALTTLDGAAIDQEFARLATTVPPLELVRDVLLPAVREVGDGWERRGGIAQEHLMSAALRHLLGSFLRLHSRRDVPIRLLFATPAGERHEIGIQAAAMLAAASGLAVTYLGPDLPASEIVQAVSSAGAQVLVLGVTLTRRARQQERELRAIVRGLPAGVELWVGGPAAERHAGLQRSRARTLPDLDAYAQQLARLSGPSG